MAVWTHVADHDGSAVASGGEEVGMADGTHEAVWVEVEVKARDGNNGWLRANGHVTERAGEMRVCGRDQEGLLQAILSLLLW